MSIPSGGSQLRYQQAMELIEKRVLTGEYYPGQKLPPMLELSKELGMNHLTLRRALGELAHKGMIEIKHGAGTFIADHPVQRAKKTIRIALAFRTYMMDLKDTHPSLGGCLVGAHARCDPSECVIQTLFYGENQFTADIGQALLDEEINGVVVFEGPLDEEDIEFLRRHRIHVVATSFKPYDDQWAITITHDRPGALSQAVEHLRALGHKQIALISYANTSDEGALHRHFSKLAFEHRLGDPGEVLILVDDTLGMTHWHDVERFFRIDPLPTAAVVNDEFLADVLLDGCERRGIKVPDRLSIVALQDARPMGHRIPLTAVRTAEDLSHMAATACDLLLKRIAEAPIPESHVVLTSKLAVKASSGPVSFSSDNDATGDGKEVMDGIRE